VNDFFQFVLTVSEGGYAWREGTFLVVCLPDPPEEREGSALIQLGTAVRAIPPPSEKVFLDFADLDPEDDAALLAFANTNGLLTGGEMLYPRRPGQPTQGAPGELREFWQEQIRLMAAAVALWKAIRAEDMQALSAVIRWRGDDCVDYEGPPFHTYRTIAAPGQREFLLKRMEPGDVVMPAKLFLQELANESLERWVSPRLLWTRDRKRMGLFIVPNSLLGFMWYQLSAAIAEFRTFRNCAVCKTPMLISPAGSGQRANKSTCSNACRVRLYAGRVLEAQELARRGIAPKQIAQKLGAELPKVKAWIRKGKVNGKKTRTQ
jgi:hypothetical protein